MDCYVHAPKELKKKKKKERDVVNPYRAYPIVYPQSGVSQFWHVRSCA